MKKQLSIIALTIILFAVVLVIMSCNGTTPPTTNNNTANGNANSNTTTAQSSPGLRPAPPDCSTYTNPTTKPGLIKNDIKGNIAGDPDLKNQYAMARNFEIETAADGTDVVLYIWGKVYVPEKAKLDKLNQTFKSVMKKGCVTKVVFAPPPSPLPSPAPTAAITATYFDYEVCEDPNELCADGSCRPQGTCPHLVANTNSNSNTNSNPNANSNSNTNTNSNSNTNK